MFNFICESVPKILFGICVLFIFAAFCKIMSAVNNKKAYNKALVLGLIFSVLTVLLISIEEFNTFKLYVMPQLQDNATLSILIGIAIFYATFVIVFVANIFILELWWKIEFKFKR